MGGLAVILFTAIFFFLLRLDINRIIIIFADVDQILTTQHKIKMNSLQHISATEGAFADMRNYELLIQEFQLDHQASAASVQSYGKQLRQFFTWLHVNGYNLNELGFRDIMEYKKHAVATLADSTAYAYVQVVCQFFRWTNANHLYPDITANVKLPKVDEAYRKRPFTESQILKMLECFDDKPELAKGNWYRRRERIKLARNKAVILMLATTGLRIGELVSAKIEDITVLYDAQVMKVRGKGRSSKTDFVVLDGPTVEALEFYIELRGEETKQDSPVFPSMANKNKGDHLETWAIWNIVEEAKKYAGITGKDYTPHSFRHFFATETLKVTKSELITQSALRHKGLQHIPRYTLMLAQERKIEMSLSLGNRFTK